MIASISGKSYRTARTMDSGLPPTPTHVVNGAPSVGYTRWSCNAARVCPAHVTEGSRISRANRSSRSSNSSS